MPRTPRFPPGGVNFHFSAIRESIKSVLCLWKSHRQKNREENKEKRKNELYKQAGDLVSLIDVGPTTWKSKLPNFNKLNYRSSPVSASQLDPTG